MRGCQHPELLPSFIRIEKGMILKAFISFSQIQDRLKDSLFVDAYLYMKYKIPYHLTLLLPYKLVFS